MTTLTAAQREAVQKQIDILEGFTSDYANEMIELYKKLLTL